jgi:hypothetical protein
MTSRKRIFSPKKGLLLKGHALQIEECPSHIPAAHQQDVYPIDRALYEVYFNDILCCRPQEDVHNPTKVLDEVEFE